jgi:cellulose synthase/poly-beta-1,6-N-acetylglucosamine synthase-like glycosyltransferase
MPVGASGALFAVRMNLLSMIPANACDDLIRPLEVIKRGYKIVFEPGAIVREEFQEGYGDVFWKKMRSGRRAVLSLCLERSLLNPFKYGIFAVQFLTKTLLRRLLFPAYVLLLLSGVKLLGATGSGVYGAFVSTIVCIGIFGIISRIAGKHLGTVSSTYLKVGNLTYYYFVAIAGAAYGLTLGLVGRSVEGWQTRGRE